MVVMSKIVNSLLNYHGTVLITIYGLPGTDDLAMLVFLTNQSIVLQDVLL